MAKGASSVHLTLPAFSIRGCAPTSEIAEKDTDALWTQIWDTCLTGLTISTEAAGT